METIVAHGRWPFVTWWSLLWIIDIRVILLIAIIFRRILALKLMVLFIWGLSIVNTQTYFFEFNHTIGLYILVVLVNLILILFTLIVFFFLFDILASWLFSLRRRRCFRCINILTRKFTSTWLGFRLGAITISRGTLGIVVMTGYGSFGFGRGSPHISRADPNGTIAFIRRLYRTRSSCWWLVSP